MNLTDQLKGFQITWLADNVKQPNGQVGLNYQTFYSYIKDRRTCPDWLVNELERITNRSILK